MLFLLFFSIISDWSQFIIKYSSDPDILYFNENENYLKNHLQNIYQNLIRVPWKDKLNDYLLFHYVIPPRIAQEPLDNFSFIYKDTLYELIKDVKDMREAVLRINEWCFTKMVYKPTERWDFNATSVIRGGYGRCEEMAILFLKSLRTVCIPSRSVYTPLWPFTESNHAWVEVWIDGKWHFLGAAEPTDIDFAWFRNPVKRTALVLSSVFGKVEEKGEIINRRGKRWTSLNATKNYTETSNITLYILKNRKPVKNTLISFSIFNYCSISPIIIDTIGKNGKTFSLGYTEYFIFAKKDSMIGYKIFYPKKEFETLYIELSKNEIPDTSFILHCKKEVKDTLKSNYQVNIDSLKKIQEINLKKLINEDTIEIFKNAMGNREKLFSFYFGLPEEYKENFIRFFNKTNKKDVIFMDTINLIDEIKAIEYSLKLNKKNAPDSIIENYLIPERILFEEFGFYKYFLYENLKYFLSKENIPKEVLKWVEKNVKLRKELEIFSPLQNPIQTYKLKKGRKIEKYILMVGLLRALGIPAKIKWDYNAVNFWDEGWKEISFEEKKEEIEKSMVTIRFIKGDKNVSKNYDYYENYTISRFDEYPILLELDEDVIKNDSFHQVSIEKNLYYLISGFRNVNGDAFIKIKKLDARGLDTLNVSVDVDIPARFEEGDLVLKRFEDKMMDEIGIGGYETGKYLIVFLDLSYESSKSTIINAKDEINNFDGKIYFIGKDKDEIYKFISETGLKNINVIEKDKEFIEKINIKEYPSILLLRDGKPLFWIEGLTLHLKDLIH